MGTGSFQHHGEQPETQPQFHDLDKLLNILILIKQPRPIWLVIAFKGLTLEEQVQSKSHKEASTWENVNLAPADDMVLKNSPSFCFSH